jgi:hypothetical protein
MVMSKSGSIALALVAFAVLTGCDKRPVPPALAPRVMQPVQSVQAVQVREETASDIPEPPFQPAHIPLSERLSREAAARPEHALSTAALIDALAARGVHVAEPRQVLASPIGALYCEAAVSGRGLALSVCAFTDAAAVAAGRARSHALFDRIVPGRTLVARGNTLLTLAPSRDATAEAEVARELFAALIP